ncbi:MAG: (Na+)-NQR maturation NqrM [Gammaproteobacteria bacterium]
MTIILSFAIFALAILGLASGLLLSGRRIQGSCGGLNQVPGIDSDCGGACRRPCPKRQARMARGGGILIKADPATGRQCDAP